MKKMFKFHVVLFAFVLLGGLSLAASGATADEIQMWRPRFPTPVLVALDTPGDRQFIAELRGSPAARNWKAQISNDLAAWNCQVVSAVYSKINRGTEPGWQLTLRVPADAPPELFTLTVSSSEGSTSQFQSVSVDEKFESDFYILHLSDEQIVNDKHTDTSGTYLRMVGSEEELYWMHEPINLIHPRFCIVTGDQIDFNGALDGWNNWMNWGYRPGPHKNFSPKETFDLEQRLTGMYLQGHVGLRVPYVETPGNHDVTPEDKKLHGTDMLWHDTSAKYYESKFGQRSWSFRMGDFYVLLHDWSDTALKKWAAADYAASMEDPSIKYRLVAQHYTGYQGFVPAQCDLMLVGHLHTVRTDQTSPYYIYVDGPTFLWGRSAFFNFRKTTDGWSCDQTTAPRDVHKDVMNLFYDNGVKNTVRADAPDSSNVAQSSVTITNDLPEEFYNGRVRFVLDRGNYQTIKNGVILAQYDCEKGAKTAIDVKVDIPAKDSITVTLGPPTHDAKSATGTEATTQKQ